MVEFTIHSEIRGDYVRATVRGDFPGVEAATRWWRGVADSARAAGLHKVMYVRHGGRIPDPIAMVDSLRRFEELGMSGWRIGVVFMDAERLMPEFQFISALARRYGMEMLVCARVSDAEKFLGVSPPIPHAGPGDDKSYITRVSRAAGHVTATVGGDYYECDEVRSAWMRIAATVARSGTHKLLVVRREGRRADAEGASRVLGDMAEHGLRDARIAIAFGDRDSPYGLIDVAASRRGLDVRSFEDEAAALAYLAD